MSDQDKINAILTSIQDNGQLMILLRALITNNLPNVPSAQLDVIMHVLGLS